MVEGSGAGPNIWEGVFSSFEEAGTNVAGHINPVWIGKSVAQFESESGNLGLGEMSSIGVVLSTFSQSNTRVLDVGGNLGSLFLRLHRQVPKLKMEYTVLEIPEFLENTDVRAHLLPDVNYVDSVLGLSQSPYDIVYFGSVIQYFPKWKETLFDLVHLSGQPSYLIFDDLMVGPQPSFVSVQKYYEDSMTMWFLNQDEFRSFIVSLGYEVRYQSEFTVSGKEYFPPASLPEGYRIPFAQSAIFRRRSG